MRYDITTKRLLEHNARAILQEICGINLKKAKLLDLPQEVFSSRRIDSPFSIEVEGKEKFILLLEWQTVWRAEKIIDLLAYKTLLLKKYKLPVKTVMVLLTKHGRARNVYKDKEIRFQFKLVKIYELEAEFFWKKLAKKQCIELAPFLGLMKGGLKLLDKALRLLLSQKHGERSADILIALTLFTGLVSKDKANSLRRKIMSVTTESPVYEWIKAEGKAEGIAEGEVRGKAEVAKAMFAEGEPISKIAKVTGLSEKELGKLKSQI